MAEMNGFENRYWLRDNHPGINGSHATMYDSELSLIRFIQAGVKGFLKKDVHPGTPMLFIQ
jgi:DNA-binding NarL/FixJ family response regulator